MQLYYTHFCSGIMPTSTEKRKTHFLVVNTFVTVAASFSGLLHFSIERLFQFLVLPIYKPGAHVRRIMTENERTKLAEL